MKGSAALVAAAAALLLAAPAGAVQPNDDAPLPSTTAAGETPAQLLAIIDGYERLSLIDPRLRPYNIALDGLRRKCTNPRMRLADFAANAHKIIKRERRLNVKTLRVLQQVRRAIPTRWPRGNCADMFTAWVILVVNGQRP